MPFQKIDVELIAERAADDLPVDGLVRVFHRWIREGALPLLAIDVADYSHVPGNASVLLVAHEGILTVERVGSETRLRYSRRRDGGGSGGDPLGEAVRVALDVASRLAEEPEVEGLELGCGRLRIRANDRRLPEDARAQIERAVAALLGAPLESLRSTALAEDRVGIEVTVPQAPSAAEMLGRLEAAGVSG